MYYCQIESPVGLLTIATDSTAITALHLERDRYFTEVPADWRRSEAQPLLHLALQQLREYFTGQRSRFDIPMQTNGTPFQQRVWQALLALPPAHTTTYLALATAIGKPNAVRAIGSAVGRNPICIMIPCHRVIASDGSLGGYVAGLDKKQQLLAFEQQYKTKSLSQT